MLNTCTKRITIIPKEYSSITPKWSSRTGRRGKSQHLQLFSSIGYTHRLKSSPLMRSPVIVEERVMMSWAGTWSHCCPARRQPWSLPMSKRRLSDRNWDAYTLGGSAGESTRVSVSMFMWPSVCLSVCLLHSTFVIQCILCYPNLNYPNPCLSN